MNEAHHQVAAVVGVRAEVACLDELFQALWHDKLGVAVVLLLQDAVGGGHEVVVHGVGRLVFAHRSVGQAHCGVGVRVVSLVGHQFAQAAHEQAVTAVKLLLNLRGGALAVALVDAHRHADGQVVVERLLLGVVQEGCKGFCAPQRRLAVDLGGIRAEVAFVLFFHHLEFTGPQFWGDVVAVLGQHLHEELAVCVLVVVLEVGVGQALEHLLGGCGCALVLPEQSSAAEAHAQAKQHDVAAQQAGLTCVDLAAHGGVRGRVVFFDQSECLAVRALAVWGADSPAVEEVLQLFFLGLNFKALEAFRLADVVLPVVRSLCVLGGVLDAHGLVGVHVALHGLELQVAAIHHRRVVQVDGLLDTPAAEETVGAPWVAHHHGEVALLDAFHADFEVTLGGVRHVVFAVRCGVVVRVCVNAHHAEVAGVAWPHPVVGVATVLAHALGWGRHQANVVVVAVGEDVVLVPVVHGFDVVAQRSVGLLVFSLNRLDLLRDGCSTLGLRHVVVDLGQDAFGHVVDALQKAHVEVVDVHFLVLALGPESVCQVVVLWGAEALDGAVRTVVVGQHQTLAGDDLRSAASAVQPNNGVLERGVVDVVDVLGGEAQARLLHVGFVDALQHVQQPHPLVGAGGVQQEQKERPQSGESCHVFEDWMFRFQRASSAVACQSIRPTNRSMRV